MDQQPLVAVLGPTASGKSDLGLRIAQVFDGEIVNYDSVQAYRYFDIGTAKLTQAERAGIPHHLIDTIDPEHVYTAGEFARAARRILSEISQRKHLPVLVGGTGFYLRALLDGLTPTDDRDDCIRSRLAQMEAKRRGALHRILRRFDPQAASRIHPNDVQKLIRAVELCLLHRQPASRLFERGKEGLIGFEVIRIGLDPPRPELYQHINERVNRMFEGGLVQELQAILSRGVPPTAKPFGSLGYAQCLAYLDGRLSLDQAIALAQQQTRHYAKRQMTWFRREPGVHWFAGFGNDSALQERAIEAVRERLHAKLSKAVQSNRHSTSTRARSSIGRASDS